MNLLPAVAALAGLLLGFWMRRLVIRHSVAEREPLRHACPRCAAPLSGVVPAEPASAGAVSAESASVDSASAGGAAGRGRLVSFAAVAAGRCPGCRGRIGPPPLTVELLTAVTLAALALRHPPPTWPDAVLAGRPEAVSAGELPAYGELLAYGWLAVVAVALVFVDVAVHRLPDRLTAAAYLGTTASLAVTALLEGRPGDLLGALLGGLALAAFYLLLFLVNPSGMGLGDVKLAASLGTALGWLGWNTLVTGAFLGFLAGGLYGGALLLARRAGRGSEIPFGPFMVAGAFAAILAGL
ncbi:A24 family peptidase [Streptosporangium sp. NPDC051022]|uniref:A24 family peptidase n=1 Tax=Streptosporangium sp. NPDC051022 TaxID=3155752 RepID=UPI00342B0A08